jgi:hypothetical protein
MAEPEKKKAKKYILLGVGGTGAKVVEAALVLLASGLGPSRVHVGLIDQDMGNGNVARTHSFINNLARFRDAWKKGADNSLDWSARSSLRFGSVEVLPLFGSQNINNTQETTALWCPEQKEGTLRDIMGKNLPSDEHKELFDLLFMADEEEQLLPLGQGYRGRAHVGSAAMSAALMEDSNPLIRRLRAIIEDGGYDEANIFLVGSAFGGTGAAGFPTLARSLLRLTQREDFTNAEKVHVAGQLMLPYFRFNGPGDEDAGPSVVTADELMPKAQLALEYYYNLFEHEKALDRLYVTGWDSLFDLKYHKSGSKLQTNPALLPELIAATAMLDFFGRDTPKDAEADGAVSVVSSARQGTVIKWADLPPGKDVRIKLGQALRFAANWRYEGRDLLNENRRVMLRKVPNWAQLLAGPVDLAVAEDALGALDGVLDNILNWAAMIEATGDASWERGPWTFDGMLDHSHAETPTEPVKLAAKLNRARYRDAFDVMVKVDSGDPEPRSASTAFDFAIAATPSPGDHKGIGRAIALLYDSVAVS